MEVFLYYLFAILLFKTHRADKAPFSYDNRESRAGYCQRPCDFYYRYHDYDHDIYINDIKLDEIYCHGDLLFTIQTRLTHYFNNSKEFVDMPIKLGLNVTTVLNNFDAFEKTVNSTDYVKNLEKFVNDHFDAVDTVFDKTYVPSDFKSSAPFEFLEKIRNEKYRNYANQTHNMWKDLVKRIDPEYSQIEFESNGYYGPNPDKIYGRGTLFNLPNPITLAGVPRFRETYYWDSYWALKGLIVSKMYDTAADLFGNIVSQIKMCKPGDREDEGECYHSQEYIPNGARIYYEKRTQPPLFGLMLKEILDNWFIFKEKNALRKYSAEELLNLLDSEMEWFAKNRNP